MVTLFYCKNTLLLSEERWCLLLHKLPDSLHDDICRFHRWQDRQACLYGKLLLIKGLSHLGYSHSLLEEIHYNAFKRPYLMDTPDFNISHTEGGVICAFSSKGRIGADIEKICPIELNDLANYMTEKQWQDIYQHASPLSRFYYYWTIKESVMKADGRGMYLPLDTISLTEGLAEVEGKIWQLHTIHLPELPDHSCHIANERNVASITTQYCDFTQSDDIF